MRKVSVKVIANHQIYTENSSLSRDSVLKQPARLSTLFPYVTPLPSQHVVPCPIMPQPTSYSRTGSVLSDNGRLAVSHFHANLNGPRLTKNGTRTIGIIRRFPLHLLHYPQMNCLWSYLTPHIIIASCSVGHSPLTPPPPTRQGLFLSLTVACFCFQTSEV